MKKMELECKILNIDKKDFIKKLEDLGAKFQKETKQYLYTYDLSTIYGRFIDIRTQLKDKESKIKYETAIEKLKLLFFELDNLLSKEDKDELLKIIGFDNTSCLCSDEKLLKNIYKDDFENFINKFHNNSKKWIRLRRTNGKTTIAVKHILADNGTKIQQMLETEIEVPSMEDGKNLLSALGFAYKSYQEKERISYILNNHEIDIDTWPGIPTYVEIEGNSEEDLQNFLGILGYSLNDTVSCTADDIYKMYGKSMFDIRELKF